MILPFNNVLKSIFRNFINVEKEMFKSIWTPTILFDDVMKREETKFYGETGVSNIYYKHTENQLVYEESFLLKFSCGMNFEIFPFDSHYCCLNYNSYRK